MKAPNQSGSVVPNPSPKLNRISPSEIASTKAPHSTSLQSGSRQNRLPWKKIAQRTTIGVVSILLNLTVLSGVGFAFPLLSLYDTGVEVETLQRNLSRLRFFQERPTGFYGEITRNAVIEFQRANNLDPDGIYGPDTHRVLMAQLGQGGDSDPVFGASCQGTFPNQNYVVVIPGNHIAKARRYGTACFQQDGRGGFTAAGEFGTYTRAQSKSDRLRKGGLDARVVYFP